jgi:hypothetical protein
MNTNSRASVESSKLKSFAVSLHSIRKSGRVLYAFTQFYLPFYNCDLKFLLFEHYDVFGCLSAAIYEIDEMIEAGVPPEDALRGLDQILDYLKSHIDCDDYIQKRIEDANRYYNFEASLLSGIAKYGFADLVSLTKIRSFDFRLMHRALAKLSGHPYHSRTFLWFSWFEMLMELEDDLLSASEDMDRGTYNVYCLATHVSSEAAPVFIEVFRCHIERNLENCSRAFSEQQMIICKQTLSAYRQIVPRPSIPSFFERQSVGGAEIPILLPTSSLYTADDLT